MFYIKLKSSDTKKLRAAFHIFLIISYMTTFSSCMTTYNYWEFPENAAKVASSDITKIELKNGIIIDCKDKLIKFEKGADSVKYIVVSTIVAGKDYKTYSTEKRIPEKDIYKIYIQNSEINGGKTAILVLGIVVVTAVVAFIIALATTPWHMKGLGS